MSRHIYAKTTPPHQIFQSGISPKLRKNHKSATSAKICVKISLKKRQKGGGIRGKCPPLLPEKPVYQQSCSQLQVYTFRAVGWLQTSQVVGIHGVRKSKCCIRNLCTNMKTELHGEGLAQSRVLF